MTLDAPTLDLLTLALLPGVGPRALRAVLDRGAAAVLARPREHEKLLGAAAVADLLSGETRRRAEEQAVRTARLGARIVGRGSPEYPARLREIYDPPPVLWVRGRAGPDDHPLAIVGSRAATPGGAALARRMARELALAGVAVVSGLARGIDAAAHRGALEGGGRTVAVLGSGLDRLYPREHAELAAAIAEAGAVVSEFPLGTDPQPGHFPQRNRIIAGWSRAVVVVEAAERSGALVTAHCAADEFRDVLAVPGHPSSPQCAGTNHLIREGAGLVRHAADVLSELKLAAPAPAARPGAEPSDPLLRALRPDAPATVDELGARTGLPPPALLGRLAELELSGQVHRLPGSLFLRR